jgi:hypothetical protein
MTYGKNITGVEKPKDENIFGITKKALEIGLDDQ